MIDNRDFGLFVATGLQGVGKTHFNLDMALGYRLDNAATGRQGRKVLIYNSSLDKMYKHIPVMRWGDVKRQPDRTVYQVQARHSDGSVFTPSEKKQWLFYLFQNFSDGLLIIEDFSNCVLNTKSEEFVGPLTTMRHKKADMYSDSGTDVLVSMQNMANVTADLWKNISYYRFHKQATDIAGQKDDIGSFFLYEIAENIVNTQYAAVEQGKRCKPPVWKSQEEYQKHRSFHMWVRGKDLAVSGCRQDTFINGVADMIRNKPYAQSSFCKKAGIRNPTQAQLDDALGKLIVPYFSHYIEDRTPPWQLNPSNA